MNKGDYIRQFYNLTPDKIKKIDSEYGDFELHHWEYKALIDYIYSLQHQLEEKDKVIDEAILHLKESIDYFLSEKEITESDIKVIHMKTIRERYLKPVLEILERSKNDN